LSTMPTHLSPIPNPQSPIPIKMIDVILSIFNYKYNFSRNNYYYNKINK